MFPTHPDDITPDWLTHALRKAEVITKSRVSSLKKHDLAKQKAWLSSVVKIEVEYNFHEENAPDSYVLKMLSPSEFRKSSYELDAYEREIKFYREFSKSFPIKLPRLFYSEFGLESNLMLMEDLSYLEQGDQIAGINHQNVLKTLKSLAKVHGTYWGNSQLYRCDWIPSTNKIELDYAENWDSFVDLCGYFINSEGLKIGEKLAPRILWLFEEITSRPKTLVNDDMKADNLLFGGVDSEESVVIVDWQFAIRSLGAIDVARLIGGSLTPGDRNGKQLEMFRHWYNELLEQGVRDYSREEAENDLKLGALYCLIFPVHFHKGIVRAQGRALEYIKTLYSGIFSFAAEIEAESALHNND